MRYKIDDIVKVKELDWYNKNKDSNGYVNSFTEDMAEYCGSKATIVAIDNKYKRYKLDIDDCVWWWSEDMFEGLVEERTPKFKVNDIVFVKNIGWVRITNSYWDSLANEYIYEAIGFNVEGEYYDSINQSNIECQMLPESENPHTGGDKITLDEYKNNDKEWLFNKLAMLDNITALESIQDIFNHLQQSKYPKTYEECCKVMNYCYNPKAVKTIHKEELIRKFQFLLLYRDAYWKIAGEEMGLGKPWEPTNDNYSYVITRCFNEITTYGTAGNSAIFSFPTKEMRDAFKENFDKDLEICKELL